MFSAISQPSSDAVMSKPTIVLVHGAWHRPVIYNGIVALLSQRSYPTVNLALPSADAIIPHKDFTGDVAAIRDCLTELVSNNNHEVVLAMHSYGAFPGSEAAKGLGKKEREAKGLKGGVIRFVVINGLAVPEGFQPQIPGDYSKMPIWQITDIEVGRRASVSINVIDLAYRMALAPSHWSQRKRSSTTIFHLPKLLSSPQSLFLKVSECFLARRLMPLGEIYHPHIL